MPTDRNLSPCEAARGLREAVADLLETLRAKPIEPFIGSFGISQSLGQEPKPKSLPVLRWLNETGANACEATQALTDLIVRSAPLLAWNQTYGEAEVGATFLERYGWSELIGLRGPFRSDAIACGFLLLGPEVEYPPHRHKAEEVYLVLSGAADWRKGGAGFARHPPGTLVHHTPWRPHAMRTSSQPLLALYLWRGGDLVQKSVID